MRDLKLMRWDKDGYPPIDLNESVKDVRDLINEIKRMREILKITINFLEESQELKITKEVVQAINEFNKESLLQ